MAALVPRSPLVDDNTRFGVVMLPDVVTLLPAVKFGAAKVNVLASAVADDPPMTILVAEVSLMLTLPVVLAETVVALVWIAVPAPTPILPVLADIVRLGVKIVPASWMMFPVRLAARVTLFVPVTLSFNVILPEPPTAI